MPQDGQKNREERKDLASLAENLREHDDKSDGEAADPPVLSRYWRAKLEERQPYQCNRWCDCDWTNKAEHSTHQPGGTDDDLKDTSQNDRTLNVLHAHFKPGICQRRHATYRDGRGQKRKRPSLNQWQSVAHCRLNQSRDAAHNKHRPYEPGQLLRPLFQAKALSKDQRNRHRRSKHREVLLKPQSHRRKQARLIFNPVRQPLGHAQLLLHRCL